MEKFDVVVIGTGAAGSGAANKLKAKGKKVAIIDHHPFGGTCALRGCDPKKVLIQAAQLVNQTVDMQQKGIIEKAVISWPELMAFKSSFTDPVPENKEKSFKKAGITTYHGTASFRSERIIRIGDAQLEADQFVIAAGSKPATLNIPGEDLLIDSTSFMDLEQLPKEIAFVGGGYIAMEFAHLALRAGSKVTILHRGKLPLQNFEADLVKLLLKATQQAGIRVLLESEVKSVERKGNGIIVRAKQQDQEISVNAASVVHAAGRTAELEDLQLEKVNVAYSEKGVKVNKYLQSISNPNVYACGDAAEGGLHLTPVAAMEAHLVASNMLNGNQKTPDYRIIPTNVFSIPPMASVGLTEQEARDQGKNIKVNFEETTSWFSSKQINETISGYKIIIDQDSDLVIGAHLLGLHAPEVINILAIAMQHNIPASLVRKMIFSYPTSVSDLVYMV